MVSFLSWSLFELICREMLLLFLSMILYCWSKHIDILIEIVLWLKDIQMIEKYVDIILKLIKTNFKNNIERVFLRNASRSNCIFSVVRVHMFPVFCDQLLQSNLSLDKSTLAVWQAENGEYIRSMSKLAQFMCKPSSQLRIFSFRYI